MEEYIESYKQIGTVKKGDYVLIEDHPCCVRSITISKTGKHGSAKAIITAIDIFTDKKYITSGTTSDNIAVPKVVKDEVLLIDMMEETSMLTIMDTKNNTNDVKFYADDEVKEKIKKDYKQGKELLLTILGSIGIEKIIESKINKD